MTYRYQDTLIIVFGACGRVGQALLPLLARGPWCVVAVARREKPQIRPPEVHWIQIDVTETEHWERSLRVLSGMSDIYEQVVVVDLLLDRSTVTSMRLSLAADTAYIVHLRRRLLELGRPSSLVLASTTAVMAPWLYQTPYGRAKRRQLFCYQSAGFVGAALLLPTLVGGSMLSAAAELVERTVRRIRTDTPATLELVALRHLAAPAHRDPPHWRRITHAVVLHLHLWTIGRDSPLTHRLASHARLALTPEWLRGRVDHHRVPGSLVLKLVQQLDTRARLERV